MPRVPHHLSTLDSRSLGEGGIVRVVEGKGVLSLPQWAVVSSRSGRPTEEEFSGPHEAKLRLVVQGGQCGGVLGSFEIDDLQDLVFSE